MYLLTFFKKNVVSLQHIPLTEKWNRMGNLAPTYASSNETINTVCEQKYFSETLSNEAT